MADIFRFVSDEGMSFNPISISGYHMREAGATAVQEVGFTLANALEYVRVAVDAGLAVDAFGPRLSFFFASHNDLFEEVAKFRAARRLWARLVRERFGAGDATARLRFHTQTGGVTLQAQQPLNNVVRVTVQALAAVLGGTQSLHTNGYDEALALPTEQSRPRWRSGPSRSSATRAGCAQVVDPLAGSYYVESSDRRDRGRRPRADRGGGRAGWRRARDRAGVLPGGDCAERVRDPEGAGVGRDGGRGRQPLHRRLAAARDRDTRLLGARGPTEGPAGGGRGGGETRRRWSRRWRRLRSAAAGGGSLMPLIVEAVRARATLGEISDALRAVWGVYRAA